MFMKHSEPRAPSKPIRGFSLLEVVVGLAIIGILAAAVTGWIINSTKATQNITQKGEFNSLVNELQAVFNNTDTCINAFANQPAFSAANLATVPATFATPIPVQLKVGSNTYQAGYHYSSALDITSLNFTGIDIASAGQYVLHLELQVKRLGATGALQPRIFDLIVQLNALRKIIGCSGMFTNYWVSNGVNSILYNGTVNAVAYMYVSDARLKENIREISSPLERVLRLRGVTYDWKDRSRTSNRVDQIGLLAQEVEEVFPESVTTNPETGMKAVGYGNLIAPIIEALKEQQEIIKKQQREIAEIKKALLRK